MRKYASLEVLEAWRQAVPGNPGSGARRIIKAAHRVAFDYEPRPGYLYVRSRMISSRTNDNHDTFPADEIEKGYRTFLGKPVFVNHHNANHRRARGVIVAIALHRDRNPDGSPDTWAEGLMEVDAVKFPKLAKAILAGRVNRTSMGVDVDWSTCSACGNKATSPAEYCKHLPAMKGKRIRQRNKKTGKIEEKLIHEVCAGLSFFENSLLVEDPADPTALLLGKPDARGMAKAASKTAAADPDFRDHLGNTCTECGRPVHYAVGLERRGRYPWQHRHQSLSDHDAVPANPSDRRPSQNPTFSAGHCLVCGDPVSINLNALDRPGGGFHHGDGMKRGHPAIPANEQDVYDSITRQKAAREQARSQMRDHMHGLFEQLEGRPLPRRPRGDEGQMPPDPFTASRKAAAIEPLGLEESSSRCVHCGRPFGGPLAGDQRSARMPHLCTDCAVGHDSSPGAHGKGQSVEYEDEGGYGGIRDSYRLREKMDPYSPGVVRPWTADDALRSSVSARQPKRTRGQQPKPVRGYSRDPKFDGVGLKKDRNGFYVHTHRSRSDSYPTPEDIPDEDVEYIRSTGTRKSVRYHGAVAKNTLRAQAYGETRVPPQVDTLRMDECPVCGEHNVWSGSRCPVCGFVVPPSVFRDPDTSKAQDVRDQLDSSGDVTLPPDQPDAGQPDAQAEAEMGSGDDADEQLVHPDQIAPDGVPTVQGGGEDPQATDGLPPQDPEEQEEGAVPVGDVPPDEAEMEDAGDEGEEMFAEELICPACGTTFEADAAAQPGVPCPACGMAALHPVDEEDGDRGAVPPEGAEDPSDPGEEPGDEEDEEEDKDMPASKTAAALAQAQARRIAELSAQNEVLHAQLSFLASAAGIDRELAEVGRRVMQRHADILNPASPVPDPPEGPPTETTEQALQPESMDNAGRPGTAPGANSRVPAQQTTTPITPGVEMQTPPATNLIDVTAPVQGTNPSQDGGVPLQQRRIETDVRIDPDPLKANGPGIGGQGDNGAAFPWLLDARMPGQGGQPGQGQQKTSSLHEADASRRTFAAIRLAKLRVQAGLAQGDELSLAERIEKDAALGTPMIEHEIGVLSQMPLAVQRQAARPVQRTAARSVPSLASVGASSQYAPAVADDLDASDLFD